MLTVLLAVVTAAFLACLARPWLDQRSLRALVVMANGTTIVLSLVFLEWLWRARVNAERSGWRQRRARAWIFWGWVLPIVNLWIPFQIMGDIWRAGLPAEKRTRTAWLLVFWWICWLFCTPGIIPELSNDSAPERLILVALAATTLIVIIRKVSNGRLGSANPGLPGEDPT